MNRSFPRIRKLAKASSTSVEVLESIAPSDVPQDAQRLGQRGVWQELIARLIADQEQGLVTVLRVPNEDEYKRMRNGIADTMRKRGFIVKAKVQPDAGSLRVYLELTKKP